MARVELTIPDEERDLFARQARNEGMTLSAWLLAAAHKRLRANRRAFGFENMEALEDFIAYCDSLPGPERGAGLGRAQAQHRSVEIAGTA